MDLTEAMPKQAVPGGGSVRSEDLNAPLFSRRSAALANRLSVRRRPIAFKMGGTVLAFSPTGLDAISSDGESGGLIGIGLEIDGRKAVLRLPAGLFERILERVEPELLAADLHDEFLPLLLEACLSDALDEAETRFQGRIQLLTLERNPPVDEDGLDILFEIAIDGTLAGKASLHIDEFGAERLAAVLGESPRVRSSYRDLKAELSFRAGVMWLNLGEFRSLRVGDVLLPDEDPVHANVIVATLGEEWLLNTEFREAGLTLIEPLRLATQKDRDLWMMVDETQAPDGANEPSVHENKSQATTDDPQLKENPDGASNLENPGESSPVQQSEDTRFDDVPIKLVFELGRMEISLGRLQELGPGHVFELDRPIGEAVEVFAGGRRVGQGEVVKVDQQVGVRMVRLFGHG